VGVKHSYQLVRLPLVLLCVRRDTAVVDVVEGDCRSLGLPEAAVLIVTHDAQAVSVPAFVRERDQRRQRAVVLLEEDLLVRADGRQLQ
jgi:hypothetical protein